MQTNFISIILTEKEIKALKYNLSLSQEKILNQGNFSIEIKLTSAIKRIRNHDYSWIDFKKGFIASDYSPKIVLLENGYYMQPNTSTGIWEIKDKHTILWQLQPNGAYPIVNYTGKENYKVVKNASISLAQHTSISLLFSNKNAIEFSRSKDNFSGVLCFTDHCDFDTLSNLRLQRNFFKEKNNKRIFLKQFFS